MPVYNIPITWQSLKVYEIEAYDLQDAVKLALKKFLNEPDEYYLSDSFEIDGIIEDNYPNEKYDVKEALKFV